MKAPALVVAVPILLGVLWGATVGVTPPVAATATVVAWALGGVALRYTGRTVVVAAVCAGFFSAGTAIGGRAQQQAAHPALLDWYDKAHPDAPVDVIGMLRADANVTPSGASLTLDAVTVDGEPAPGGIRLTVAGALAPAAAADWRAGRTVALTATLHPPIDYRNPGVASDRERLARQGIALLGSVKSAALTTITARGPLLSELAGALRAHVRKTTATAVGQWSQASAAIVTAILIGDRSALDADDERRLQEAGTYHVIAISGGNIALLTALLVACGRILRLSPRGAAAASILLLAFYGYAAGLAPSVLRATIAGMIYLAARAVDHRGAVLNAIAVAASVAAVAAPLSVLDPGFVLSFGATFAIILAAHRLASEPPRRRISERRIHAFTRHAAHAARLLGAATLCAEFALAPVGARLFGRVSLAGLGLNFIAIPLMSIIQVAGLIAVTIAPMFQAGASLAGWLAHVCTVALLRSASLVDVAPGLVLDVPPPAWTVIAAWYIGAGCALFTTSRWRIAGLSIVASAAAAMIVGSPPARATLVTPAPAGWTRVVFFDVGQGDATLIQPPDAPPILVDAGGVAGTTFDLGRRVTLPAAWAFGVTRLGALVLTHGDPDHIGGAPPLLRPLAPREIWDGIPVPPHVPMQRLRASADRAHIPWTAHRAGDFVKFGRLRIRVLNPPEPDWERRRVRNDDSIVLEIRTGNVAFLLPGDVTRTVEPAVVRALAPAPTVIVKAPHHGSAGSSSQEFVDALHPSAAIFSAGPRNPFGHPARVVVDRYRSAGAQIFSTAEDGAVVVDTDGSVAVVWTWGSRRPPVTLSPSPTPLPFPPASPDEPSVRARAGSLRAR